MSSPAAPSVALKLGGFAAVIGGLLLVPGAVWISFSPSDGTEFGLLGPLGTALAAVSVLGLYPLVSGGGPGALSATLGAAVALTSLASLVFVALRPPDGEPSRLYLASSVLAWWILPVGISLLALALVRADILFGRALLLFLVAFLEAPLLSNIAARLWDSGWSTLLFGLPAGLPGAQTGLLGAIAWVGFGYSLFLLGKEEDRDSNDEESYRSATLKRL